MPRSTGICDYYKAVRKDIVNCPNCHYWLGSKCAIEAKVKGNDKTAVVHEEVYRGGSTSRVTGVLK